MSSDYPITGFYFRLTFPLELGLLDTSFKEVSGMAMEMGIEEIAEGGENRFKHRVPTGAKYQNLVLKRGLTTSVSALSLWCEATLAGGLSSTIIKQTVIVSLMDENSLPIKNWSFVNAWPVKWEFSPLNSMNNEIVIETLELTYDYSLVL
ncbi:phage tail protein [Aquimarina sp. RZ0]|uniref:phage tail protein n=1 Tax=Aquimarina sp. RZ0 TaxID=2607730 RepID=UPI0011F1E351|nr:phage tail protein [Aquimarina sp. RZ0]KAA1247751.1 phage tail protein [Aquimarina sp. RZ0]